MGRCELDIALRPGSSIRPDARSSPRVGGAVGGEQPRAVDAGIDLRRRQRGVAEQVLDGAQIAAARQADGWRTNGAAHAASRCRAGRARRASAPSPAARRAATSGPPFAPTNSGPRVSAHRGRARGNPRRLATGAMIGAERVFLAFADNGDRFTFADRRVGATDRQRLGNAQARAVAERQHGGVARQHPMFARLAFARGGRSSRPWRPARSKGGAGGARPWARGWRRAPKPSPRLRERYGARATAKPRARVATSGRRFPPPGGGRETRADRPGRNR